MAASTETRHGSDGAQDFQIARDTASTSTTVRDVSIMTWGDHEAAFEGQYISERRVRLGGGSGKLYI